MYEPVQIHPVHRTAPTCYVFPFLLSYFLKPYEEVFVTEKEKVQSVLEQIRPSLQADGGDIELVNVKNGVVSVKLTGHCAG
jgi:hypothetical protein